MNKFVSCALFTYLRLGRGVGAYLGGNPSAFSFFTASKLALSVSHALSLFSASHALSLLWCFFGDTRKFKLQGNLCSILL